MVNSVARGNSKAPSQRQLRVGELVRHAVTQILGRGGLNDPALETAVISVSEVRMSPDLKIATCFVTPLGGENTETIVAALNRTSSYIRRQAGPELRQMKFMPQFKFRADTSYDEFGRIDALLRSPEVQRDLAEDSDNSGDD